jgi:D-alanyl-lipoteichoic acid acyltransferase DltB (MBOAT superfamily)
LISETLIYFLAIPATLAYLLLLLSFSEKRKGKTEYLVFPLREAAIATIALDFVVIIPDMFNAFPSKLASDGLTPLLISFVLFIMHFYILIASDRLRMVKQQTAAPTQQKRLLNLLLVTYIGLFCLMTNAVSFQAILTGKGSL